MRIKSRELLAVGIFGCPSRLGERIETLLRRGRDFSPRASLTRVALSGVVLLGFVIGGAVAPRWIAFAQQPARLEFEVASIKPHGGTVTVSGLFIRGSRVTEKAMPLLELVTDAYGIDHVSGGPSWIKSDRFDIVAKADREGALTMDQVRLLLQTLLADRFQLKVHRETKEVPVYALVVGRGGQKLKESAADAPGPNFVRGGQHGPAYGGVAWNHRKISAPALRDRGPARRRQDRTYRLLCLHVGLVSREPHASARLGYAFHVRGPSGATRIAIGIDKRPGRVSRDRPRGKTLGKLMIDTNGSTASCVLIISRSTG